MKSSITRIFILSLAIALLGIPRAVAGEGSADIGRPPPYGYYANERGPAPSAYGFSSVPSVRTTRPVRSR
jgi:hypothetical protein